MGKYSAVCSFIEHLLNKKSSAFLADLLKNLLVNNQLTCMK
jgi:hypothetical protein